MTIKPTGETHRWAVATQKKEYFVIAVNQETGEVDIQIPMEEFMGIAEDVTNYFAAQMPHTKDTMQ